MNLPDTFNAKPLFIDKPKRGRPFASIKTKWRFLVPLLTPLVILLASCLTLAIVQHVCFMLPSVGIGYLFVSAHTLSRSAIASR